MMIINILENQNTYHPVDVFLQVFDVMWGVLVQSLKESKQREKKKKIVWKLILLLIEFATIIA